MKIHLILILILFSTFSYSQSFFKKYMIDTSRWERKHNIHLINNKVFTTTSYATGSIFDGFVELVLDELDSDSGNLINRLQIPNSYKFEAYKSITYKNNIYGIGWLNGNGGFSTNDVGLYKIATDGDQFFFVRIEDENRKDIPADLILDTQENIFVGSSRAFKSGAGFTYKSVITKVDSEGNRLWEYIDDIPTARVEMRSVITDDLDNIYALFTQDGIQDSVRLTKLTSDGSRLWTRTYQEGFLSKAQQILNLKNGNLLIAGYAFYDKYNGASSNFYMEIDTAGNPIWINDYKPYIGGVAYESGIKILEDGRIARVYDGYGYPVLMVTHPDGEVDFTRQYNDLDVRFPDDLLQLDDGSFVIVGWINPNSNSEGFTSWMMRTDTEGHLVTSIAEIGNNTPGLTLFPNPTNSILNIDFDENSEIDQIVVFDLLGRKIQEQKNNHQINVSDFHSGTYILSLIDKEGKVTSRSFVKQ